jgi:hypothetical protein
MNINTDSKLHSDSVLMLSVDNEPFPYALLFGGDQFMIFSLLSVPDTTGAVHYGLFAWTSSQ